MEFWRRSVYEVGWDRPIACCQNNPDLQYFFRRTKNGDWGQALRNSRGDRREPQGKVYDRPFERRGVLKDEAGVWNASVHTL